MGLLPCTDTSCFMMFLDNLLDSSPIKKSVCHPHRTESKAQKEKEETQAWQR